MIRHENIVNARMKLATSIFYVERDDDEARKYRNSPNKVCFYDIRQLPHLMLEQRNIVNSRMKFAFTTFGGYLA